MKRRSWIFASLSIALGVCTSTALAAADPALLKARQKFFGMDNVDVNTGDVKKDKVIASWATNTTYVVSIMGRVVLLDSYITRPSYPARPLTGGMPRCCRRTSSTCARRLFSSGTATATTRTTPPTLRSGPMRRSMRRPNLPCHAAGRHQDGHRRESAKRWCALPAEFRSGELCRGRAAGSRPGQYNEGPNAGLMKSSATKLVTPLDSLVCVLAFKFVHSGTAPTDPSFSHATLSDLADPRYAGREIPRRILRSPIRQCTRRG